MANVEDVEVVRCQIRQYQDEDIPVVERRPDQNQTLSALYALCTTERNQEAVTVATQLLVELIQQLRAEVADLGQIRAEVADLGQIRAEVGDLRAMVESFIPATPVEKVVNGRVIQEARFKIRKEDKVVMYCRKFASIAQQQGYHAEVVGPTFMVYLTGQQQRISYQCAACHRDMLRAYTALRLHCGDKIDWFMTFVLEGPLSETNVAMLSLSPDDNRDILSARNCL